MKKPYSCAKSSDPVTNSHGYWAADDLMAYTKISGLYFVHILHDIWLCIYIYFIVWSCSFTYIYLHTLYFNLWHPHQHICAKCKHSCTKLLTSIGSVQKCIKLVQTSSFEAQKHEVCTAILRGHCRNLWRSQNTIKIIIIIHATDQTAVSLSEMTGGCSRPYRHITQMDGIEHCPPVVQKNIQKIFIWVWPSRTGHKAFSQTFLILPPAHLWAGGNTIYFHCAL